MIAYKFEEVNTTDLLLLQSIQILHFNKNPHSISQMIPQMFCVCLRQDVVHVTVSVCVSVYTGSSFGTEMC